MAYSLSNPPVPISAASLTSGPNSTTNNTPRLWVYASADPIATVQGAGYFSNGIQLAMQVGDIVFVIDTNLTRAYMTIVTALTLTNTSTAFKGVGIGSATLNNVTTPVAD